MEDSDDDMMDPAIDSVSLSELQFFINQLESTEARQSGFESTQNKQLHTPIDNTQRDTRGQSRIDNPSSSTDERPSNGANSVNYGTQNACVCSFCQRPKYVTIVRYGTKCCKNCHIFIRTTIEKGRTYSCIGQGNCSVKWGTEPICKHCRWKHIVEHPNTKKETLIIHGAPSNLIGDQSRSVEQPKQSTSSLVDNSANHNIKTNSLCSICENPNYLTYMPYGLRCCQNCQNFIARTTEKNISYKCLNNGNCPIKWARQDRLCRSCRWEKLIGHPLLIREKLFRQPRSSTDVPPYSTNDARDETSSVSHDVVESESKSSPQVEDKAESRHGDLNQVLPSSQTHDQSIPPDECSNHGQSITPDDRSDLNEFIPFDDDSIHELSTISEANLDDANENSNACYVCGNPNYVCFWAAFGVKSCNNCFKFMQVATKGHNSSYVCSGDGECEIRWTPDSRRQGIGLCRACRLKKFIQHPQFKHAKYPTIREKIVDEVAGRPEISQPAAKVRILTACEIDGPVDEFGLPLNIEKRYSRWLYNDFSCFQPGSVRLKKREHEVSPRVEKKAVISNNKLDDHLNYLTSDIEIKPHPQLVEDLTKLVVEIRPSVSLLNSHWSAQNKSLETNDTPRKKSTPLLTFIIMPKLGRNPIQDRSSHVSCGSQERSATNIMSESLIGPGEDCDDSDENVIIEIDCDTIS